MFKLLKHTAIRWIDAGGGVPAVGPPVAKGAKPG